MTMTAERLIKTQIIGGGGAMRVMDKNKEPGVEVRMPFAHDGSLSNA